MEVDDSMSMNLIVDAYRLFWRFKIEKIKKKDSFLTHFGAKDRGILNEN
jgi:hypothetical protein